jgi:hypothetical protein
VRHSTGQIKLIRARYYVDALEYSRKAKIQVGKSSKSSLKNKKLHFPVNQPETCALYPTQINKTGPLNMKTGKLNTSLTRWLSPFIIALALLSGCSSSTDDTTGDTQSRLYISLTDAEGDFTQYKVDVTELKLYRANGSIIETMPATTTLDFAQYVDVTEFLTTTTVPLGNYKQVEVTLDFSNAEISVENADGNSVPATAVDENNDPLGVVTITTTINGNSGFTISRGKPSSLSIDFNLEASNEVVMATDGSSATVTVNPVLVADTEMDDNKTRRLRGLLNSVDEAAASFIVDIRPFRIRHNTHGEMTVLTDSNTVYEIDGTSYDAITGLSALALLDTNTPIIVLGNFNMALKTYTAVEVYAGTSVPWDSQDVLKGSVIARSGNTLTVLGATVEHADGHFVFNDEVTVEIDDTTAVTRQGSDSTFSIDDLSVGQRVVILGDVSSDNTTMDATTDGLVRMRYSDIAGSVVAISPLEVNLQTYNQRNISQFDFTGTGVDAANDADPAQYQINSGTLSLDGMQINDPVKLRGFPTPFGTAPEDFTAITLALLADVHSKIIVNYPAQGADDAITTLDENGLLLSIDSANQTQYLVQAGIFTDLSSLSSIPLIIPNDGAALYVLQQHRRTEVFNQWQNFQDALSSALSNGDMVKYIHCDGEYDASAATLLAQRLVVRIKQ